MDRQCSSCGGFCKKSGCERENVKSKEWVGLTDEPIGWIYEDDEGRITFSQMPQNSPFWEPVYKAKNA